MEELTEGALRKLSLDELIEMEEKLSAEVNNINFKIEGLKEEADSLDKHTKRGRDNEVKSIFSRRKDVINRQLFKLNIKATSKMHYLENVKAVRESKTPIGDRKK